jgi:hypothetical protein
MDGEDKKEYCLHGHELTPQTTYIRTRRGSVERECKICRKEQSSRRVRITIPSGRIDITPKSNRVGSIHGLSVVQLRKQAIIILGSKCANCEYNLLEALQIDHKENNGNIERSSGLQGYWLYKEIYEKAKINLEEILMKYQLLCANCHIIKHRKL